MESKETIEYIWLEVSNVALTQIGAVIEVQLKGDQETDRWLQLKKPSEANKGNKAKGNEVNEAKKGNDGLYKSLVEAMKDKRPIHAKLAPARGRAAGDKPHLVIEDLRVMFAANTRP